MKRGKPHKRETQNKVGELSKENLNLRKDDNVIDKYLPPRNRYRTWLIRFIIIKEYYEKHWY